MVHIDAHYTPAWLAVELINAAGIHPKSIADFASGDGALLETCYSQWPKAKFIANDISVTTANQLKDQFQFLHVFNKDFISEYQECIELTQVVLNSKQGIDLVVLNPPFTCKGSKRIQCNLKNKSIQCSVALAFFVNSLKMLSSSGVCLAILPESCLTSEKDSVAISIILEHFDIEIIEETRDTSFKDCNVRVTLIKANKKIRNKKLKPSSGGPDIVPKKVNLLPSIYHSGISRGKVTVSNFKKSKYDKGETPFLHTTSIVDNRVNDNLTPFINTNNNIVTGPLVIFPRVGRPSKEKIAFIKQGLTILPSDCIITLSFDDEVDALLAFKRIIDEWESLERLYTGTCARYLTLNKVDYFLRMNNITSSIDQFEKTGIENSKHIKKKALSLA